MVDQPQQGRRRWITPREYGFLGLVGLLMLSTHWFTVNISASVPLGLYRYVQGGELRRGGIVHIPAVAVGRSWPYSWLPLLKPVAGVAGDTVCVQPEGVWVNGVSYGPVYQTHKGQPLPVFWGCHVVQEGEVFVASHAPKSLDSRYFKMVRIEDAVRAVPYLTWR